MYHFNFSIGPSDYPVVQPGQAIVIPPSPSFDIPVNLTVENDNFVECNETFMLRLVSLDTDRLQIDPACEQATVTIIDDDGLYFKCLIQYVFVNVYNSYYSCISWKSSNH